MSWRVHSASEKPKGRLAVIGLDPLSGRAGRKLQEDFARQLRAPATPGRGGQSRTKLLPVRRIAPRSVLKGRRARRRSAAGWMRKRLSALHVGSPAASAARTRSPRRRVSRTGAGPGSRTRRPVRNFPIGCETALPCHCASPCSGPNAAMPLIGPPGSTTLRRGPGVSPMSRARFPDRLTKIERRQPGVDERRTDAAFSTLTACGLVQLRTPGGVSPDRKTMTTAYAMIAEGAASDDGFGGGPKLAQTWASRPSAQVNDGRRGRPRSSPASAPNGCKLRAIKRPAIECDLERDRAASIYPEARPSLRTAEP